MGLPVVRTGNVALDRFLESVREYIETSKGGGNPNSVNRVLRVSDIPAMIELATASASTQAKRMSQSDMEKLAMDLSSTRVFQSITGPGGAIDDVLDGLPRKVISDVREGANNSLSAVTSEAVVGLTDTQALAAQVTSVTARLDDFDGTATIEEAYLALANKADGFEAQYTMKVTAGGAVAGFGLAATDPVGGTPSSAFLIAADKFAIVSPTYNGGLTNTPNFANVPFGVDASGVYINGTVRINAGGSAIQDGLQGPAGPTGPAGATGATGPAGATGARGSLIGYGSNYGISSSSWNNDQAQAVIFNMINGTTQTSNASTSHLRVGDTVTLSNGSSFSATRFWAGSWLSPGVTIDGNLLVSGTIAGDKIAANAINSDKIGTNTLSAVTISTTGAVKSTGSIAADGSTMASLVGYASAANAYGVFGYSQTATGGFFQGATVGVQGFVGSGGVAVKATNSSSTGTALEMQGRLKWGTVPAWAEPSGTGTLYLCNDGTWAAPTASVPYPTSGSANANTITLTGATNGVATQAARSDHTHNLPFTPVQQGGGAGQLTNKLYIGWNGSNLLLQVDSSNFGASWPINISGNAGYATSAGSASSATTASSASSATNSSQLGGYNASDYLRYSTYAGGAPSGTAYTLYVVAGGLTFRIPAYYP